MSPRKSATEKTQVDSARIYTGCTLLDLNVGGAKGSMGYPSGKFINIVGDTSSGKTFLCCELIAATYHQYKNRLKWIYDDCESGFTFDTENLYGIEIMPKEMEDRASSRTVQDMAGNIRKFLKTLKNDEFGIYIVDSLDGLSSEEIDEMAAKRQREFEKGNTLDKGSYQMQSAKFLSQEFFRTLTYDIQDKNALIVFVSQVRHNVDPVSRQKWTRAGGKALDFFAYSCLWLRTVSKITRNGRIVGVVVEAESKKLKAPRGFRKSQFSLYFDYGVDDIGSNIDYLYNLRGEDGRLKKKNAIDWNEEVYTRPELISFIEENNLREELRKMVIDQWEEEEDLIKSDRPSKYGSMETHDHGKNEGKVHSSEPKQKSSTKNTPGRGEPAKDTES